MEEEQKAQKQEVFEAELAERKTILQYLDMQKTALFDTEEILKASGRKLKELDSVKRNLEREEDQLKTEYRQLTEGRTLELEAALESEFSELGLPVVYGMEWLKKNGNTEEKNRELIHHHPFLPYALILTKKELKKLISHPGNVSTSFPDRKSVV